MNIGGFFVDSEGTSFNINIYNLTDFTLKIGSLDNIATEVDGDGFLRTTEGFMVSSDEFFLDYAYLVKADDGAVGFRLRGFFFKRYCDNSIHIAVFFNCYVHLVKFILFSVYYSH